MRRLILTLAAIAAVCVIAAPAPAFAAAPAKRAPVQLHDVEVPMFPIADAALKPPGFKVTAGQALTIAETSPTMLAIHHREHPLQVGVFLLLRQHYEVYFQYHGKVVGDVIVERSGRRGPTYTGPLTIALYGRGHYGDVFDSPWVLIPFGLMFLLPLAWLRRRGGGGWLARVDLLVVLTFGVSYALFNHTHLVIAVWLAYPPLLYLMGRMLWRGRSPAASGGRLDCRLPVWLLALGVLALAGARIALALTPTHVMDVGGAEAIGAYRIIHGQSLYFSSLGHPDTYGPIAYLAYVPFELIWPSADWATFLPSVRAGTITFDVLTIAALVWLGIRLRPGVEGRRLGLVMAWLWAACPFSLLGMVKNTNDGLIALLMVAVMLTLTTPIRRGVVLGLAAAAKFIPAILLPMLAAPGPSGDWGRTRKVLAGFVIAGGLSVALFLPPGGLQEFYDHTLGYQLTRTDVFSIWALHPTLAPLKIAVELAVAALAVGLAFRPRGVRTPAQVAALAGALTIAVQLPAVHWFYLYIVWFLPFVLIAVLAADAPPAATPASEPAAAQRAEAEHGTPPVELVEA